MQGHPRPRSSSRTTSLRAGRATEKGTPLDTDFIVAVAALVTFVFVVLFLIVRSALRTVGSVASHIDRRLDQLGRIMDAADPDRKPKP